MPNLATPLKRREVPNRLQEESGAEQGDARDPSPHVSSGDGANESLQRLTKIERLASSLRDPLGKAIRHLPVSVRLPLLGRPEVTLQPFHFVLKCRDTFLKRRHGRRSATLNGGRERARVRDGGSDLDELVRTRQPFPLTVGLPNVERDQCESGQF